MDLQTTFINKLVRQPNLLKLEKVDEKWFVDRNHKEIINVIKLNNGNDMSTEIMFDEIKKINSHTLNTAQGLRRMEISGMEDFGSNGKIGEILQRIEYNYYAQRHLDAVVKYGGNPSQKNRDRLDDATRELEQLKEPKNDGTIEKAVEEIRYELQNETKSGIKFYPTLDKFLGRGLIGGEFMIVGARTGIGKTAFAINLAINAMEKDPNLIIDFFTLEMNQKQMLYRMISNKGEFNNRRLKNANKEMTDGEKNEAKSVLESLNNGQFRIFDQERKIGDITRIITRRAYKAQEQGKTYLPILDYVGLARSSEGKVNQREIVEEVSRELKQKTIELEIPIIALAQMNRNQDGRQEKKPMLSDLRDSASLEMDANIVMFLWNPDEEEKDLKYQPSMNKEQLTELVIAKSREGFTGDIRYRFLKSKGLFFEE